jgi:hypothetical protein
MGQVHTRSVDHLGFGNLLTDVDGSPFCQYALGLPMASHCKVTAQEQAAYSICAVLYLNRPTTHRPCNKRVGQQSFYLFITIRTIRDS